MSFKVTGTASAFRKSFTTVQKDITKWYPGHMHSSMKDMQRKLKSVDCILELHDARVPFSGRNPDFQRMLTAIKPHILLLNKMDLADPTFDEEVIAQLKAEGISNVLHIKSSGPPKNTNKIVPLITNLVQNSERYHRREEYEYNIMIIGIPNVGKSSLINTLRSKHLGAKGQATRVGALAGVTKSVLERIKICEDPPLYLFDTPGIMTPLARDVETGLKLALCGNMRDHLVGEDFMADYLLYRLNRKRNFSYVGYLGLDEPCDDIRLVLYKTAMALKATLKVKTHNGIEIKPNLQSAAVHFIRGFREGLFGKILLDDDLIRSRHSSLRLHA